MKPHSKYTKSVTKLKSVREGPNDTHSQFGDIIKAARSERMGNRESTKEAIRYALLDHRQTILKMCNSLDKSMGKIDKEDFLRILRTYGIFPTSQAISKQINYNLI